MKVLRQISKFIGLYRFLILYTLGLQVTQEALDEVATLSGVMSVGDDYLPSSVREECERSCKMRFIKNAKKGYFCQYTHIKH